MTDKTQQFPLEKILTISASEYSQMSGKNLSEYIPVGVHADSINYWVDPTDYFASFVPKEAEIVVNYQINRSLGEYKESGPGTNARGIQFTAHGTALIPKNSRK